MDEKITSEQLHIRCRFPFLNITECQIHAAYGTHTAASMTGTVNVKEAEKAFLDSEKDNVTVSCRDASGIEKVLFTGMISRISFSREGRFATVSLKAASYSYKMDIKRKSRSFQDLSRSFRDVAETVISGYGGKLGFPVQDRKLKYPLIQYRETDFQFLKRMLSYIGTGITAGDTSKKIRLTAGISSEGEKKEIHLSRHPHSEIPYRKAGKMTGYRGYEIWDAEDIRVGDAVSVQGKTFYVKEEELTLKDGILDISIRVFPKACFEEEKIPADTLSGTVLNGVVLKTAGETVKLKLDIDKEQEEGKAYPYPWRPVTGNFLYCMPEPGTRAALYFGRAEESSGMAIYNIRENGDILEAYKEYPARNFTTVKNKRMELFPSSIELGSTANSLYMSDGGRIGVSAGREISILAEGTVSLKGETVVLRGIKEATLVRKDMIAPTVINMCNAFDAIGKVGGFAPTAKTEKEEKEQDLIYYQESEYSLAGALPTVLGSLPADTGGNKPLDKISAAMPWLG